MILSKLLENLLIIGAGILVLFLIYLLGIVIMIVTIDMKFLNIRLGDKIVKPLEYTYYKDLIKEDFSFYSKKNKLNGGIFYKDKKSNNIIIVVHGYGANYKNYFAEINYFTNLGYTVYTYDGTGTSESSGKVFGGAPQAIKDLIYAIREVKKLNKDCNITLFGHSMGGYAVCNVLKFEQVDKVIAVAPFDNMPDIINDKVISRFGKRFFLLKTVYKFIQFIKFGKYSIPTTYKTLSKTNVEVLVIHGDNDMTVKTDHFLRNMEINTNSNIHFLLVKDKMHRPLQSSRAVAYHEYVKLEADNLKLKNKNNLTDEQIDKFNASLNQEIKNELDVEVLNNIEKFLKEK